MNNSKIGITVLIQSYNEQENIKACIESAEYLTADIIVVDMESNDKTIEIIKSFNVQLEHFPFSRYVEPAREFGIRRAKTDWVMILDADERITKKLAEEIKEKISTNNYSFYKIPRKNIFGKPTNQQAGKWLRYGGWSPDYQTRLINKKYLKTWPKEIHSTPQLSGSFTYLDNPLLHYFHGDLEKMVNKTIVFEDVESSLLFAAGRKSRSLTFFRKFFAELYRRLIGKLGFLDGKIGIIESIYQAFSKTITYLFLYEKNKGRSI